MLRQERFGDADRLGIVDPGREVAAAGDGGEVGLLLREPRACGGHTGTEVLDAHLHLHERGLLGPQYRTIHDPVGKR